LRVLLTGGNGGLASLPLGGLVGGGLSAPLSFAIPSLFADPFLVVVASLRHSSPSAFLPNRQ
jgi:hypothetical protein